MAITNLERQLGMQLFLRHPGGGLILTPAGQELLIEARNLLDHADDFAKLALGLQHEVQGSLAIGCFLTIAPFFMPSFVQRFVGQYPCVDLKIKEGSQDDILRGLLAGNHAVAFLYDVNLPSVIQYEPLKRLHSYVLLSADHRFAERTSVNLRELADDPFILLDVAPSRDFFLAELARAGITPRISFRSSSFEMVRGLVGHGLGYSILITRPSNDTAYDGRSVRCVAIEGGGQSSQIVIARLPNARPTRLMQTFWDFSKAVFNELPDRRLA